MTGQEFTKKLIGKNRESGNPVQESFLAQAGFWAIRDDKIHGHGDFQACLQAARKLQETTPTPMEQEQDVHEAMFEEPRNQQNGIYDHLEGPVEALREDLFDCKEAPFAQWSDALAWLESEKAGRTAPQRDPEQAKVLRQRSEALRQDWEAYYDRSIRWLKPIMTCLEYPVESASDDYWVTGRAPAPKSHREFQRLNQFMHAESERTGLKPSQILVFVLSGDRLEFGSSVQTSERGFGTMVVTKTTFEIPSGWPSWDDVRKAFKFVLRMRRNRKGLSQVNKVIIEEFQRAGGIPEKGTMKFWDELAEKVNEKTGKVLSGRAAKRRFDRLPDQIVRGLSA